MNTHHLTPCPSLHLLPVLPPFDLVFHLHAVLVLFKSSFIPSAPAHHSLSSCEMFSVQPASFLNPTADTLITVNPSETIIKSLSSTLPHLHNPGDSLNKEHIGFEPRNNTSKVIHSHTVSQWFLDVLFWYLLQGEFSLFLASPPLPRPQYLRMMTMYTPLAIIIQFYDLSRLGSLLALCLSLSCLLHLTSIFFFKLILESLHFCFGPRLGLEVSQTQITTQDVTHLCHEIRDIKKGQINIGLPEELSKLSSSTPDPSDTCGRDAPGYVGSIYNKLCPNLPTDSHDSPVRHDSSPPLNPSPPSQRLPGLPVPCTPSPVIGTSVATAYATVAPSSRE